MSDSLYFGSNSKTVINQYMRKFFILRPWPTFYNGIFCGQIFSKGSDNSLFNDIGRHPKVENFTRAFFIFRFVYISEKFGRKKNFH